MSSPDDDDDDDDGAGAGADVDTSAGTAAAATIHVACLCAAWCRTCDEYAPMFEAVLAALRAGHPGLRMHWIDIEDEADLVGDYDVETFPTIVVADGRGRLRFAGPLTPQPETLQRVLRAALAGDRPSAGGSPGTPPEAAAFGRRLVARRPG